MRTTRIHIRPVFIDIAEIEDGPDDTYEPYAVLRAKTKHLAELLSCTEQEAERLILDRAGSTDPL